MKFLEVEHLQIFDRCLVRQAAGYKWRPALYAGTEVEHLSTGDSIFVHVIGDKEAYDECIPWEGNEMLAWTKNVPHSYAPEHPVVVVVRNSSDEQWRQRSLVGHDAEGYLCLEPDGLEARHWKECSDCLWLERKHGD